MAPPLPSDVVRAVRTGALWRLACALGALLCLFALPARAATYSYTSTSYAWESTTNSVTWSQNCTSYPVDDDQYTLNFSGGFTFTFGGVAYSSVRVMANGGLQFGADTGFFRNYWISGLPAGIGPSYGGCTNTNPTNVMLPYWMDLQPSAGGSVTWQQKGTAPNRYVVVSWNGVYEYGGYTPYTFQVILYENGQFKYQYGNAYVDGSAATIGVQLNSSDYTQYSSGTTWSGNGSALLWYAPSSSPARVAEYRMDETAWNGTAGQVLDSSGNGHNGTAIGSVTNVSTGYVCRAESVPANTSTTSAAVNTTLVPGSGVGNAGTLSFWFNSNASWTSGTAAMLMDATSSSARPFYLMRASGGALTFAATDSAGTVVTTTTPAQSFGASSWHHVAATWHFASGADQTVLRVYIDGVPQAATLATTSGAIDTGMLSLYVGDNRSALTPSGGTVNSANGLIDEVRIYSSEIGPVEIGYDMAQTHPCTLPLDHLVIQSASASGLTCSPNTFTVQACQDSACATPYTAGVSGTLAASGTGMTVNWPSGARFTIPSGSSTTTVSMQLTTAGSVLLSASGLSPSASSATQCNFGSPSCTYAAASSALLFSVPNHVSNTSQTISVSAVRASDNATVCVPAFASVSKSVNFSCAYGNPATGTLPVRTGGVALNAAANTAQSCDATGQSLSLAFNASGVASTTVQYADVGQVQLSGKYTGSGADAGLVMTGSSSFVVAPSSFGFSGVTAGPIKAGTAFAANVSALNASGAITPNFGRENPAQAVSLAFTRAQPTGTGASNGVFSGTLGGFAAGVASASNLVWSEVGTGDLSATLTSGSYLGSGLSASGSTGTGGAVGRFTPHHFDVAVTPACGSFTYAAQPFTVQVTARNGLATPGTTVNYDGSSATTPNYAKAVTLSDALSLGVGSLGSTGALVATAFTAGVATVSTPAYTFTNKLTAAQTLAVRATDTDGISSSGYAEGSTALRSGRLRLSNTFGSERTALQMPVQAQYWSGKSWVPNSADNCSVVPAAAVVRSSYLNNLGASSTAWTTTPSSITLAAGNGTLTLSAPSPSQTGSVNLALNLGSSAVDQSCLAAHPSSTGAALPWLRSQYGNCATSWASDPSARGTFGIYSPESQKTIHVREIF